MPVRVDKRTLDRFATVVSALLQWYQENQRSFIWREVGQTPYIVMVSEFMLQQTQAAHIQVRLPLFLKQFPTIKALAQAPVADVLRAWQGLGYNRRALNLKKAAESIHERYQKGFPTTYEELIDLPGIGPYTASAILAFAYNANVPVVDVNIERVLSRVWKQMLTYHATLPVKEVSALDKQILPQGKSGTWHQALMDLGATICIKRDPKCDVCPLLQECKSGPYFLRNRNSLKATVTSRRGKEKLFFGHPRRIWRGRILKTVTSQEPTSTVRITKSLIDTYEIDDASFKPFVELTLQQLHKEGLIAMNKKQIRLP